MGSILEGGALHKIKSVIIWCSIFGSSTKWVDEAHALLYDASNGDMMAAINLKEKVDSELERIKNDYHCSKVLKRSLS
jgi:hypothetical protein